MVMSHTQTCEEPCVRPWTMTEDTDPVPETDHCEVCQPDTGEESDDAVTETRNESRFQYDMVEETGVWDYPKEEEHSKDETCEGESVAQRLYKFPADHHHRP